MRFSIIVAVLFFAIASNAVEVDNNYLKCLGKFVIFYELWVDEAFSNVIDMRFVFLLVCRTTVKEVQEELAKVDPKRKIDIGNYRLDAAGNEIKKSVSKP